MKHVMFCHTVRSDWNHGNAHFLRGLCRQFALQGHTIDVHEPAHGWSATNLVQQHGAQALDAYRTAYPDLAPHLHGAGGPDVDQALTDADVVLVHEWSPPELVAAVGRHHATHDNYDLFFHDSHHRAWSAPKQLLGLKLDEYTVLAFGESLRRRYLEAGISDDVHTWHEAADTDLFRPADVAPQADVVWIGNWGDGERARELEENLLEPVQRLGLTATTHGVRYPPQASRRFEAAGFTMRGWIANHDVPAAYAAHRATVHVPRRAYVEALPGIPTIRMFEAFACGIPLVVSNWQDTEGLFPPDAFHAAPDGDAVATQLQRIMADPEEAARVARRARTSVLSRHTCGHRVRELHDLVAKRRTPTGGGLRIAFFGSSLLSTYWNGAATYYRGLLRALAARGHTITFYEPEAFDRGDHRDMDPPSWCDVVVYAPDEVEATLQAAATADVIIKASGIGACDDFLEEAVPQAGPRAYYWDVDAPATIAALDDGRQEGLRRALPSYEGVFTYGGGPGVVAAYERLGARSCTPVHNALDPSTHHPASAEPDLAADLAFLGNRLPDRDARVERFFISVARALPQASFVLGGAGWDDVPLPSNVRRVGHVGSHLHNAFNGSSRAVLNINRDSMAAAGHSPPTRIFEAAGAGACIITDAWPGIEAFLTPGKEILVAHDGEEVAAILAGLDDATARRIGRAARQRVLREHTYAQRATQVHERLARTVLA